MPWPLSPIPLLQREAGTNWKAEIVRAIHFAAGVSGEGGRSSAGLVHG